MELRGKQKRFLRALGVNMEPILTIGKEGISEHTVKQAVDALLARELIKGRVLTTSPQSPDEAAAQIALATESEVVQVVGRNFLLYKQHPQKPGIELP